MATSASLARDKAKEVLRQVEFYFSDSNLPRDKFLSKTVKESDDGLVSLALLCSFSRMKRYLGLVDVKPEEVPEKIVLAVAETLRKSSFLKVSDDGKSVGRSTELLKPDEVIEQVDSRTIAVSPLQFDVRIEDLESFFSQHGKVNSVRLPRHAADKKLFCGTAFIEFSEEDVSNKILKENLVYDGAELEIKPKKDFDSERAKKRGVFENSPSNKNESSESWSYPKGLIIAFKLNSPSRVELQEVVESINQKNGESTVQSDNGKDETFLENALKKNVENAAENVTEEEVDTKEGARKKAAKDNVEGKSKKIPLAPEENVVTREELKESFQRFGTVKFVDYKMGEESGHIRFENPDAAVKARASAALIAAGGVPVKNCIATIEAVTGEAEMEYWNLLRSGQDRLKDNKASRGRDKGNKGGRYFHGKRSRQEESGDGRQSKAQKVAAGRS